MHSQNAARQQETGRRRKSALNAAASKCNAKMRCKEEQTGGGAKKHCRARIPTATAGPEHSGRVCEGEAPGRSRKGWAGGSTENWTTGSDNH